MKIKTLDIYGIGGIKELHLEFSDGLNVICGVNGIGKTTILNIIIDIFSQKCTLKRNATVSEGKYIYCIQGDKEFCGGSGEKRISTFEPNGNPYVDNKADAKRILNFDINRILNYISLTSIPRDPDRNKALLSEMINGGIKANDVKGWFVNRFLFNGRGLEEKQISNYKLACDVFNLLDDNVAFKKVEADTLDIIVSTPNGDIYFEYLSAGYKNCIYIIWGIIKEIEFRFKNPHKDVAEFEGIILIDEVDLHLHPTWQAKLVHVLKKVFLNAQFILTTHSPSILQTLERDEIIPLKQNKDGSVAVAELNLGEYGLQGWTLEEILQDVMGMPRTTSDIYQNTIDAFDRAMYDENIPEIRRNYEILDKMLHPKSTLRKLLQIQMVGLEE